MPNNPTAVGIHIYAGGFTEGMRRSLSIKGHLETSKFGVETAKLNLGLDIRIDPELKTQSFGPVDVIYGNPPCVAFSRLGHQEGLVHPTIEDVRSLVRLGLDTKPSIWTWECVSQAFTQGKELVNELVKVWIAEGYHCTMFLTDAHLHGAAQRRHRFHFIASRVKLNLFTPLQESWGTSCDEVLDAMKPEIDPKNLQVRRYLQWMEKYAVPGIPLRRVWFYLHGLDHTQPKPEGLRFCPPFCIQRLMVGRPSVTLTGGPDFIHPREWRVLSPGEMAALSGFSSDWKWLGNVVDRYKQVAKGVTPSIGRYLGKVFKEAIELGQGIETPGFEIVDIRNHQANTRYHKDEKIVLPAEWYGIAKNNQVIMEAAHVDSN